MPESDMEKELAKSISDSVIKAQTQTQPSLSQSLHAVTMPRADPDVRSSSEHISDAMDKLSDAIKDAELLSSTLIKFGQAVAALSTKLQSAIDEVSKAKSRL